MKNHVVIELFILNNPLGLEFLFFNISTPRVRNQSQSVLENNVLRTKHVDRFRLTIIHSNWGKLLRIVQQVAENTIIGSKACDHYDNRY